MSTVPTPGEASGHTEGEWRYAGMLEIVDGRGKVVARLWGTLGKYEREEANARRIVQCVNSHDDLVAALKGLMVGCEYRTIQGETGWHSIAMPKAAALDAARAALAKAGEKL